MNATAIVGGKVVKFVLPPALAKAHQRNAGRTLTDQEAVDFVETKRRRLALRRAKPGWFQDMKETADGIQEEL